MRTVPIRAHSVGQERRPDSVVLMSSRHPLESLADRLRLLMAEFNRNRPNSSARIARASFPADPPSMAKGEMTARGNLSFNKLLKTRSAQLVRLYDNSDPCTILFVGRQ